MNTCRYGTTTITLAQAQIMVGDGWSGLVEKCFNLCHETDIEITQIKEKYGGLRFYVGISDETTLDAINDVEQESYKVCEVCGKPGELRDGGWYKTLCDECDVIRMSG